VDAPSVPYVQGAAIDVVPEGLSRRVRFENPNARQTCGCGESFAA
jgi:Fe-S cluster assembly iron-binding protein IscA